MVFILHFLTTNSEIIVWILLFRTVYHHFGCQHGSVKTIVGKLLSLGDTVPIYSNQCHQLGSTGKSRYLSAWFKLLSLFVNHYVMLKNRNVWVWRLRFITIRKRHSGLSMNIGKLRYYQWYAIIKRSVWTLKRSNCDTLIDRLEVNNGKESESMK